VPGDGKKEEKHGLKWRGVSKANDEKK